MLSRLDVITAAGHCRARAVRLRACCAGWWQVFRRIWGRQMRDEPRGGCVQASLPRLWGAARRAGDSQGGWAFKRGLRDACARGGCASWGLVEVLCLSVLVKLGRSARPHPRTVSSAPQAFDASVEDLPRWERLRLMFQYRVRCVTELHIFHAFFLACILGNTVVLSMTYNSMSQRWAVRHPTSRSRPTG